MIPNKNQPKIAFIIPSLSVGGAERVVTTLTNSLIKYYDIIFITIADSYVFYTLNERVKIVHLRHKPIRSSNMFQAIFYNLTLLSKIKKTLKAENIDICIGFTTTANILTALACNSLNIPSIISERSNPKHRKLKVIWRLLRKYSYKKVSKIVLQTDQIKAFYSIFVPKSKLIVLPNPLSQVLIDAKDHLIKKENIILSVGRLDKNKSQDLLIKAFYNINPHSWKLILVGSGSQEGKYKALVKELKLDSKVTFTGSISNVHDYYNKAKIFAFCSQTEGFPNVLIEAMYFQLACVSSNCEYGPSEVIKNADNGYLFKVNHQNELEEKLTLLINDESLIERLGHRAAESSSSYFPDRVITLWNDLISNVLLNVTKRGKTSS